MYARFISFTGADAEKRERAVETIRDTVIPRLREYDGYGGYVALYDEESGRAKAFLLWKTKEAAEAAEPELSALRAQIMGQLGFTIESVELYEAPVVDLEAGRG